ncbi:phage tail protein [Clostridium saccharoperbutylacetonicum]|uniref:phage tail protein n=1 Tax=Clostridium saccharoperbutylacetonicum TaxID=36745 RepID=UPI000983FC2C|nr:phage tail protein [Clostridium saccharoperbutylacetonicum]AQR93506.1 hypothetical protein CLSAP_08120 [Clostridium saccharoperbutylacetonicum]NSB29204.1 hypothetical protein [Clostridium saccharoperbutylacetonicum]
MSENFYTILTATGKAKLANSAVLGSKVNFKTLKVGDGNGAYYEPTESQTSLVREVWSGNVSSISVDENNPNWIVAETLIPATIGGFFIREAGIFDEDGDLIAISKLSETYKPVVSEGSIKDLCIKIILEVSNVSSVTLKIDPTVIVATRKDIDVLQAKMDASNTQTAEEIKELDSKLSEQISELANEISNKTVVTPAVGYGMNNVIKNVGETSVSPKFTIQGKTVINLLGKDGNCEDISKWFAWQTTLSLDSTNKVFGSNGIKVTLTNTQGTMYKPYPWDTTKYYCISAYVKNGNTSGGIAIAKDTGGGGIWKSSSSITDTTKFTRVFIKLQPSDLKLNDNIVVSLGAGTNNQYVYVDGIMTEEITQAQYNDSSFIPSPYVDSYACLQNPYVEVRHDNLVRNGNGEEGVAWWTPRYTDGSTTFSIENGKIKIINTGTYECIYQDIKVKPNTDYWIQGNVSGTNNPYIEGFTTDYVTKLIPTFRTGGVAFNSGNNSVIRLMLTNTTAGTSYYDSIMIVEGATALNYYKPCKIERCVVEGKFADGDSLVLENGEVTGKIIWKHKTLFGKDYDWTFLSDYTGFKGISLTNMLPSTSYTSGIGVKYDGKILPFGDMSMATDKLGWNSGNTLISASDSDTGWAESINPNNDEVKAFMNGWKAIWSNGTRYVGWRSIIDGSLPLITTRASGTNNAGQNKLNVADASSLIVGDLIFVNISSSIVDVYTISAISGNQLTLSVNIANTIYDTAQIMKSDNGSSNTQALNSCKNNVALGYEGYQLHYKLQNPEPITDINTHIHGDIPKFDIGDNYLYLDSGIVLGEVANPTSGDSIKYRIADYWHNYTPNMLKYKNESIFNIYKNNVYDTKNWDIVTSIYAYGNYSAGIPVANFDTSATYTVDYKILATQSPQIGALACEYVIDILSVLNKVQEEANNKQNKDSILDQIVDLSLYEKSLPQERNIRWFCNGGYLYIRIIIPFINIKKTNPIVTIDNFSIQRGTGITDVTKLFYMQGIVPTTTGFMIAMFTTDSTTISDIKSNGIACSLGYVADCRGRV